MEDIIRESFSEEDTYNIGREFGEAAEKGDVYCFYGDLGVGNNFLQRLCQRAWYQLSGEQPYIYNS